MTLRVFIVIWGALVLTLLLFGTLVAALDPTPPEGARVAAETGCWSASLALWRRAMAGQRRWRSGTGSPRPSRNDGCA